MKSLKKKKKEKSDFDIQVEFSTNILKLEFLSSLSRINSTINFSTQNFYFTL